MAGRPPFEGGTPSELMAARSSTIPRPIEELRKGVPVELASLVGQCLQKSSDSWAAYLFARHPQPAADPDAKVAIAVLPLRNIGGDSALAVLTDGFTDEIATALVPTPWLRVMSRAGANNCSMASAVTVVFRRFSNGLD